MADDIIFWQWNAEKALNDMIKINTMVFIRLLWRIERQSKPKLYDIQKFTYYHCDIDNYLMYARKTNR